MWYPTKDIQENQDGLETAKEKLIFIYAELKGCLCPNALLKNLPSTTVFPPSDKTFLSNILKKLLSKPLILFEVKK